MSISITSLGSFSILPQTHQSHFISQPKTHLFRPKPKFSPLKKLTNSPNVVAVRAVLGNSEASAVPPGKPRWEKVVSTVASLYPIYVTIGGVVACLKPSAFAWFVKAGPTSYTLSLGLIMLAMGLTLELKDMVSLFRQRPLSVCLPFVSFQSGLEFEKWALLDFGFLQNPVVEFFWFEKGSDIV